MEHWASHESPEGKPGHSHHDVWRNLPYPQAALPTKVALVDPHIKRSQKPAGRSPMVSAETSLDFLSRLSHWNAEDLQPAGKVATPDPLATPQRPV